MSAIRTKDSLLSMIKQADNHIDLYEVAKTIVTIMKHTEGFWIELNYCYKAAEILDRLSAQAEYFIRLGVHPNAEKKLENIKLEVRKIADQYRNLQNEHMNPVVEHCNAG